MKKIFQKQREVIAILVFMGVVLVLVYFAIIPLMKKIDLIGYQIQENAMKQEIVKQHIGELPKIQKQYETLKNSGDLTDVLLDKEKAVILIEKLEKMAEKTNNEIVIGVQEASDIKKAPIKGKVAGDGVLLSELPSADHLRLKITIMGNYDSIVKFVKSLENFEYYSDIVGIQIDKSKSDLADQTSAGSSILNPFVSGENSNAEKEIKKTDDMLTTSLDTVFYVRQN